MLLIHEDCKILISFLPTVLVLAAFDALKQYGTCESGFTKCTTADGHGLEGMALLKTAGAYCDVDADCYGDDSRCSDGPP